MNAATKFILSGVALVTLAGYSAANNGQGKATRAGDVPGPQLTVKALGVTTSAARVLRGAFEIRAPNPGEPSIASNGFGGACLVAQLPVQPKACHANQQCNIGHGDSMWGGYCLGGTCWVKPSENYCLKGVGVGQHSTPAVDASDAYAYAAANHETPPIKWRVLGCLNGVAVSENSNARPACPGGPGEVMHDAGDPTAVP